MLGILKKLCYSIANFYLLDKTPGLHCVMDSPNYFETLQTERRNRKGTLKQNEPGLDTLFSRLRFEPATPRLSIAKKYRSKKEKENMIFSDISITPNY